MIARHKAERFARIMHAIESSPWLLPTLGTIGVTLLIIARLSLP